MPHNATAVDNRIPPCRITGATLLPPSLELMSPMHELGARAKAASRVLAGASTATKDAALSAAADLLVGRTEEVLAANALDVDRAEAADTSATVVDRLRLTAARIEGMAAGLRNVATLPDPIGEVADGWVRPNGLRVRRVRVPLGVVAIVYENRPNVTSDAAGLCVKSGNAAFLRGSSGAISSNIAITAALREGFVKAGLPPDSVTLVEDTSHEAAVEFMRLRGVIDCLIPVGVPRSSRASSRTRPSRMSSTATATVTSTSTPTANLPKASEIVVNAKVQRPSVCNAMETLLVHRSIAGPFLKRVVRGLETVELVGDDATREILGAERVAPATDDDYATEFLALKLAVKVVDSLDEAIEHITRFGSGHSEAILTGSVDAASRFTREVDAAAVLVNASTRFVDGEELGFGAEIGISTQKLHARGPMGLRELTTLKWVIEGDGQIRT